MKICGWFKKLETSKATKMQSPKAVNPCPECGGRGFIFNDNHCLPDGEDYDRKYPTCWRCHGTGRYHVEIDKYWEDSI